MGHWEELRGSSEGNVTKSTLVQYCTQGWSLYKLGDGGKWQFALLYDVTADVVLKARKEKGQSLVC